MRSSQILVAYLLCALTFLRAAVAADTVALEGEGIAPTGPVTADLDGNPLNGLESAVATSDGTLQVVGAGGEISWSVTLPNVACSFSPKTDKLYSAPVVAELFGDGVKYLVVGYGGFQGKPCDGGVAAYRARDGKRRWVFSLKRWATLKGHYVFRHAVYGTPRVADVDGDGKLEVGFGSFDRHIYLLNSDGSVRWYAVAADTVFSSPSFVDLDNDGKKEMIISTDISRNTRLRPPTPNGGYVYALKAAIKVPRGTRFGFRDPRLQMWRAEFDQVMQASPVVGDVLPQSQGIEVVVGSGCFFPQGDGDRRGKWYKVLRGSTGQVVKTLHTTACTAGTPAIADIDRDGRLDVVGLVSGGQFAGGDGTTHLFAWSPSRNKVLWDVRPLAGNRTDRYGGHFGRTPIIQDLTGDGIPEIVVVHSTDVLVFASDGSALTCDTATCTKPQLRAGGTLKGYVTVRDTDSDGDLEIIAVGTRERQLSLLTWENPFM